MHGTLRMSAFENQQYVACGTTKAPLCCFTAEFCITMLVLVCSNL